MEFKKFYDNDFIIKTPKPYKTKIKLNLQEYTNIISKSNIKSDKKILLKRILENKGDIPIFCEQNNKFFMCDFSSKKKKSREIKSREDKLLCGVLLNAMIKINENFDYNQLNLNWDIPNYIFNVK